MAMQKILDEGFKTREQIGGTNVTGGGPSNAISFTLNLRTAIAIALGIYTIRGIARGEILLGDLILQAKQVAPNAFPNAMRELANEYKIKTSDDVRRVDAGLEYFYCSKISQEDEYEKLTSSDRTEMVGEDKYSSYGWAPSEMLASFDDWRRPTKHNRTTFEAYKYVLSYGWSAKEIYDPFFLSTDLGALSKARVEDIGILMAKIDADWVCSEWNGAIDMGFDPQSSTEPRLWPSDLSD